MADRKNGMDDVKVTDNAATVENQGITSEKRRTSRFTGSYNHTMDAKGRLVIPAGFRDKLGETFYVAPSYDFRSIAVYPNEKWEEQSEKFESLGKFNAKLNAYLEQFYALSFEGQECDNQGRLLLPANIRAKILGEEKEIEITGANDHVRIVAAPAGQKAWDKFNDDLPDMLELIGNLEQQNSSKE